MFACNCVKLRKVDGTGFRLNVTAEFCVKPFPVSKRTKAGPPAVVLAGNKAPTTGCTFAAKIVSVSGFEVATPADPLAGLVTVMVAVPALEMSPGNIEMLSCVAVTKVVCRAAPSKFTTELLAKLEPFTCSVNPAAPARTAAGFSDESPGAGLEFAAAGT